MAAFLWPTINFLNKVESIGSRLTKFEEEHIPDLEKVFFDGEYLRVFIKELFSKVKTSIVVVCPYADAKALGLLSSKDNAIPAKITVSSKTKLTQGDIDAFVFRYGTLTVKRDDLFHDRFIVIDGKSLYHLGTSLNYVGRKTFAISELTDERFVSIVIRVFSQDSSMPNQSIRIENPSIWFQRYTHFMSSFPFQKVHGTGNGARREMSLKEMAYRRYSKPIAVRWRG